MVLGGNSFRIPQLKLPGGVIRSNVYIVTVRTVSKICACTCSAALLAAESRAIAPDNSPPQYQSITERNVFGLRPPPAQPSPTNPPAQLPRITLTGITTVLGNKRALMKVLPFGLKPGETAKELSLILTEGQRESEVEVLQIDEKAGSVKVNNSGTVMTLTFEKDGAKLPASSVPGMSNAPSPLPVAGAASNPYLPGATAPAATVRKFPPRNTRLPAAPPLPGVTSVTPPAGGVPTPTGVVPAPAPASQAADAEITAEEQAIIQEIQRQVNANTPNASPQNAPTPAGTPTTQIGSPVPGVSLPVPGSHPALVPQ